jgi:hypothetical protein
LARQSKKAYGALLTVGILQAIFAVVIIALLKADAETPIDSQLDPNVSIGALAVAMFGIAAMFLGLAFWAKRNPLPAAIVGLVLYITVHLLDALADPTAIARGVLIKVIIVVVLVRAISAGAKHRALARAMAASATT